MALTDADILSKYSMANQTWFTTVSSALPLYERQLGLDVAGESDVIVQMQSTAKTGLQALQEFAVAESGILLASPDNVPTIQGRAERWKAAPDPKVYISDDEASSIINLAPNGAFKEERFHFNTYNYAGSTISQTLPSHYTGNHFLMQRGSTQGPLTAYVDLSITEQGFSDGSLFFEFVKFTGSAPVTAILFWMDKDRNVFKKAITETFSGQSFDWTLYRVAFRANQTGVGSRTNFRRWLLTIPSVPPYGWVKIIRAGVFSGSSGTPLDIAATDWIIEDTCDTGASFGRLAELPRVYGRTPVGWKAANNYGTSTYNHVGQTYTDTSLRMNVMKSVAGFPNAYLQTKSETPPLFSSGTQRMTASVSVTGGGSASVTPYIYLLKAGSSREKTPLEAQFYASTDRGPDAGTTVIINSGSTATASVTNSSWGAGGQTLYLAGYWRVLTSSPQTKVSWTLPTWLVNGVSSSPYGLRTWEVQSRYFDDPATDTVMVDFPKSPYIGSAITCDADLGLQLAAFSNVMWMVSSTANSPVTVCMDGAEEYLSISPDQLISVSLQAYWDESEVDAGGPGYDVIRICAIFYSALPATPDDVTNVVSVQYEDTIIYPETWTRCRLSGVSSSHASTAFVKITIEGTSASPGTPQVPTSTLPAFSKFGIASVCVARDVSEIDTYARDFRTRIGFNALELVRDDTRIINLISYETPQGTVQYLSPQSVQRFGLREQKISTVAVPNVYLDGAAAFSLQKTLYPEDRIDTISFLVGNSMHEYLVANLVLGDVCQLRMQPPGSSVIERMLRVERISVKSSQGAKRTEVELTVSDATQDNAALVEYARLDSERTAF